MQPISFLNEALFYLLWGGIVQFFFSLIAAPILYPVAVLLTKRPYQTLFRAYAVMNVFLLLWGCLGSYIFMSIAFGKLYVSIDRLVDWYAFLPFGQWVLDDGFGGELHGHLIGDATLSQIQLLWLAIAVPVWALSICSTWLTLRFLVRRDQDRHWGNMSSGNLAGLARDQTAPGSSV